MTCCNCHHPFSEHCAIHVIPCCPGKCLGSARHIPRDSVKLSYLEIIRTEKYRALCLGLSILCLLIVAACIYLAQS